MDLRGQITDPKRDRLMRRWRGLLELARKRGDLLAIAVLEARLGIR